MTEKNQIKDADPSKNEKNAQICASSHICILCFQGCIDCKESTKNFKRHISSNGPHLVSPQKAKKFSKTQNEVTVKPYIISFFYRHPVFSINQAWHMTCMRQNNPLQRHFTAWLVWEYTWLLCLSLTRVTWIEVSLGALTWAGAGWLAPR